LSHVQIAVLPSKQPYWEMLSNNSQKIFFCWNMILKVSLWRQNSVHQTYLSI